MTIRRGQEWGTPATRPPDLVVAAGDAELAALVAADPARPYGIRRGDIYRSLGEPPDRDDVQRLPVDAMQVELDGSPTLAVAHVVARNSWWRGPIVAVLNCGYVGNWNIAPRAHPNDGRLDVVEVDPSMSLRQRIHARGRVRLGTHVPHPSIAVRTAQSVSFTFDRPTRVWVDGAVSGRCSRLDVTVLADHFTILI